MGVDLSVYSLTKYMNGHTDVLMGSIVTNREDLKERLAYLQNGNDINHRCVVKNPYIFSKQFIYFFPALGAVPSPFDCYLMLRSLRTLHVRMPLHMKNALRVAKFLQAHPKVEKVLHPGLPSHPQHEIALKQSSGHSGLISFYVKEGAGSPAKFLQNLNVFKLAESLGGYESLAELP